MPAAAPRSSFLAGIEIVPLHRDGSGDIWTLIHDRRAGKTIVRHIPNAASGGQASDTAVAEFLAAGNAGPEHRAVLDWIERTASRADGRR